MFGFVLAQAYSFMTADVDALVKGVAESVVTKDTPSARIQRLDEHLRVDPNHVKVGGLFDANGNPIAGNMESMPRGLLLNDGPQLVSALRIDGPNREALTVRAVARRLSDGGTVVIGRTDYEIAWIVHSVERALALGLVPALCLGMAAGVFLSVRAQQRVQEVNRRVQRIVAGDLRQRLPAQGTNDPFDKLAGLVNGMLDEIETLIRSVAGVGDDIAHDLRTPLTRMRVSLERGRQNARTLDELRATVDQAIVSLDQSLAVITALLRIAEIEHGRRLSEFRDVALAELVREVADLYEPIAEDKKVGLVVAANNEMTVHGDRDLLFEAIANLVDNAVKFTPEGGRVELSLAQAGGDAIVRVRDTGPGIAAGEQDLVARRFYRSDKSRCNPGFGLGLSLVNAIVKLHGFRFAILPGPGCVAEIAGERAGA
jgi:signal transduction histidine kinase